MGNHPSETYVPSSPQDSVVGKWLPQARDYIAQLHFAIRWGDYRTAFWPVERGQN